ncbi:MAG: acid phosphatase AphA [Candidatus Aminicenantes bacterium]|jgi:acid phosphatase (class B)
MRKALLFSIEGKRSMSRRLAFVYLLLSVLCFCCSTGQEETEIRWVTMEDIISSLENQQPMRVGFDVDDTTLFSSPGYYYGQQKYSPGSNNYLEMEEFWNEMNNGLDEFSLPKECARRLIEFHKNRGDAIYFITARWKTETETVTELLAKIFNLDDINDVIFTNLKSKAILANNIQIFYGDSDGDIRAAIEAGIRGVRIMRAGNSTHRPYPEYGSLGEEVLVDSGF